MYKVEDSFWWYRGLRSLLRHTISQLARKTDARPLRVLDAGCGTGANLTACRDMAYAVGVDLAREALAFAAQRGIRNMVRGRVQEIPLRNNSCDVVLSIDVLYHQWIENDLQVLREYYRVLVPGGWLVIHVAAHEWLRGSHDEVVMTRHRYTRPELVEKVSAAGFRVRRATYRNSLLLPFMLVHRVISSRSPKPASDLQLPPSWVNQLLYAVLCAENTLLRIVDLPVGGSLFILAQRPVSS